MEGRVKQQMVVFISSFKLITVEHVIITVTIVVNCHYYSKSKGNLIHATSCLLGLYQHNSSVPNSALLGLVLTTYVSQYLIVLWLLPTTTIPHFILILN
jgi:hypothetical protein